MTSDQVLNLLSASGLVEPALVDKLRQKVAQTRNIDGRAILKPLVDRNEITAWQAKQLLAGRNRFLLGRHLLLDCVGAGGMGVVFRARHAVMDRTVAVKVMARRLVSNPTSIARFEREVKAAAALNHPHIITAHDADAVGQSHFLVTEYVDGHDLNYWLQKLGPFDPSAACEFALQSAQGLRHAARNGMVHRDIKPGNLLVAWDEEHERPSIKLLDMGLARLEVEDGAGEGLTQAGQPLGTADYVAPEAARNFNAADTRSDIFSLGCTLFKVLTGKLPFSGTSVMEKLMARATEDAPPVQSLRSDVPEDVAAVVAKMLAREPAQRYQTADELIEALRPHAASTQGNMAVLAAFKPTADPKAVPQISESDLQEIFADCTTIGGETAHQPQTKAAPPQLPPSGSPARGDDLTIVDDDAPQPAPTQPSAPRRPVISLSEADAVDDAPAGQAPASQGTTNQASSGRKVVSLSSADMISADPSANDPAGGDPFSSDPSSSAPGAADPLGSAPSAGDPFSQDPFAADPLSGSPGTAALAPAKRKKKSFGSKGWDSPLMMLGGGGLLLLVILGGALYWAVNRQTGDEVLAAAEEAYNNRLYSDAISHYDRYIAGFPDHPEVSRAKVNRGLARLRQTVDGVSSSGNWPSALEVAHNVLDEIGREDAFATAHPELTALLPQIAEGLAENAAAAPDPATVEQARDALALANRDQYVPLTNRPVQRLKNVELSLEQTSRVLARDEKLAAALEEIAAANAAGETDRAFGVRDAIIREYPNLLGNEQLEAAVREISEAERQSVEFVAETQEPLTEEPPAPVLTRTNFVRRTGDAAPGAGGRVFGVLADGLAIGVDAQQGEVLWRRFVGFDTNFTPLSISASGAGDMLLVDSVRNEIVRLASDSGELVWRQPIGEPISAAPGLYRDQVLVPTSSGKLYEIDLASGQRQGYYRLPQPLGQSPAVDSRKHLAYITGERANVYVLSLPDRACRDVIYVGHDAGTVRTPPTLLDRYVVIAESTGADRSRLQVFLTEADGMSATLVQQIPRLRGQFHRAPLADGRSLHAVTDSGGWYLFDVAPPGSETPLSQQFFQPHFDEAATVRYPVVSGNNFWLADQRLTKLRPAVGRGGLEEEWSRDPGDVFLQPPVVLGNVLLDARRRSGMRAVTASARNPATGETYWQVDVTLPLAGGPLIHPQRAVLQTLTSSGELFELEARQLSAQSDITEPAAKESVSRALPADTVTLRVGDDTLVFAAVDGRQQIVVYDPTHPRTVMRSITLPDLDELAGRPALFGEGMLAPGKVGQVYLLNPHNGRSLTKPFQPEVAAGRPFTWHGPALLSADEALLADSKSKLYRLGVLEQPAPHLAEQAQPVETVPLVSDLAITGDYAYAVSETRELLGFALPQLEAHKSWPLIGAVEWGPLSAGNLVLLATTAGEVYAVDGTGELAWQANLPQERPVGAPLLDDGNLLLATHAGRLLVLDPASGSELARADVGRPLASGPVSWGSRIVLAGHDGTILTLSPPQPAAP